MSSRIVTVAAALIMWMAGCARQPSVGRTSYTGERFHTVDEVTGPSGFSLEVVRERLRVFLRDDCSRYAFARFTVVPSLRDLAILGTPFYRKGINATPLDRQTAGGAQVVCVAGVHDVVVRQGGAVQREGEADSKQRRGLLLSVGGLNWRVISFSATGPSDSRKTAETSRFSAKLRIFLQAPSWPKHEQALMVTRWLGDQCRCEVAVFIREDSLLAPYGGPLLDIGDLGQPFVTEEQYEKTQTESCRYGGEGANAECRTVAGLPPD